MRYRTPGEKYGSTLKPGVGSGTLIPAALLLIGHIGLTTKRFLVTEAGKVKADEESAETNRMMGLALQGQGQLDMAFDRFQRVPMSDELMPNLYNLALDFERKRHFNKAEAVFKRVGVQSLCYAFHGDVLAKGFGNPCDRNGGHALPRAKIQMSLR